MFSSIPSFVTSADIVESMTQEFDRVRSILHSLMRKKNRNLIINPEEYLKTKRFGNEKVQKGCKVYKSFFISHMFVCCFFGSNFCFLESDEIVYRTKAITVIHIASRKRAKQLFEMNGVCMLELNDELQNVLIAAAGRVVVKHENGKEEVGIVMDEDGDELNVVLESKKKRNSVS